MEFDFDLFQQLLVSGLVLGSVYALLAVSFGIIYATTETFHLAHSVVYTVAAYAAIVTVDSLGLPLAPAALAGLAAAVALGIAIETVCYRPMRRRNATVLAIFLASLGLAIVGPNLIQIMFGPENRNLPGFPNDTITLSENITFTVLDLTSVVVCWTCVAALSLALRRTRYGRAITAVRTNQEMAMAVGIPVERIFAIVFAVGSLLVGVAALLFTMDRVAFPTMGLSPVLTGFIAVFLGGIGSTIGAAVGGLTLGLITSLSGLWLSGDYSPAVVFGLLFILLLIRPQGLFGRPAT
jgi:branched-chain amino acid transport system permease protein